MIQPPIPDLIYRIAFYYPYTYIQTLPIDKAVNCSHTYMFFSITKAVENSNSAARFTRDVPKKPEQKPFQRRQAASHKAGSSKTPRHGTSALLQCRLRHNKYGSR